MLKAIVPPTSRASGRLSALGISLWILLVGGPLGVILAAGNQVCAEDLDGDREVAANVIRRLAAPVVREQPAVGGVESVTPETWNVHGQFTLVGQYNPDFHARYRGQNSFLTGNQARETIDLTIFAGVHVWQGCDFYANPEMDQGFGLSNTLGLGGYSSGEAYKVGQTYPYARLPRAFFRQVIALSPQQQAVEGGANQLAEMRPVDNVTLTIGKFSVADIFDTNKYAHDTRADFLNWSVLESGAFDYAADSWGYTYGAAIEWNQHWWSARAGGFNLSLEPNSKRLERSFGQYALIGELEAREDLFGHPGKIKLLGFLNQGRMADYMEAVRLADATGAPADASAVRRYSSRGGIALNIEQEITQGVGAFARLSYNDGSKEAFDFTDINKSIAIGISVDGARWSRPHDTVGFAQVFNGLSIQAQHFFAAGGLGLLIGDGQLLHYEMEKITELYYSMQVVNHLLVTADYQFIDSPAYNPDRGPISILGLRVHAEF